jgi:hypothetical protein
MLCVGFNETNSKIPSTVFFSSFTPIISNCLLSNGQVNDGLGSGGSPVKLSLSCVSVDFACKALTYVWCIKHEYELMETRGAINPWRTSHVSSLAFVLSEIYESRGPWVHARTKANENSYAGCDLWLKAVGVTIVRRAVRGHNDGSKVVGGEP